MQLHPVEGRTVVERGDVTLIDYEARVEDRVIGRAESRQYEMGGGSLPEAFDERLVGASVGEERDVPVAYPADDRNPDLAGKTVAFHVAIRGLSLKEIPPLDDDFAKDHGECETLAELRDRIRKQLEAVALRQADDELRARAMSALGVAHDFEVPDAMVARQIEEMMIEVAESWRARRIWPKDEAAAFASLREELAPRAREQVKGALLLDAIARQEHIEVTDQEIDAEIERAASAARDGAERMRALSARPEARENLRQRLTRQRALDFVVSRADVTTVERPRESVAGEGESR